MAACSGCCWSSSGSKWCAKLHSMRSAGIFGRCSGKCANMSVANFVANCTLYPCRCKLQLVTQGSHCCCSPKEMLRVTSPGWSSCSAGLSVPAVLACCCLGLLRSAVLSSALSCGSMVVAIRSSDPCCEPWRCRCRCCRVMSVVLLDGMLGPGPGAAAAADLRVTATTAGSCTARRMVYSLQGQT